MFHGDTVIFFDGTLYGTTTNGSYKDVLDMVRLIHNDKDDTNQLNDGKTLPARYMSLTSHRSIDPQDFMLNIYRTESSEEL